ncbi:MAG: hypothetical protein WB729_12515 [Candidatus Sulfotelmatobacter sp.]
MLSATHYMEMDKIKNPEQRGDVAGVMEELSGYASLVNRATVMELELAAMLDRFVTEPILEPEISLLGRGVRHSLGRGSGLKIFGPSGDVTGEVRTRMGAEQFDSMVDKAKFLLEQSVLRGPTADEVGELRALGWQPQAAIRVAENRAIQEQGLTPHLDDEAKLRRGRLRDVIAARELSIEFQDMLPRALARRGISLTDIFNGPESGRQFVRSMPSTEVSIELKTTWHRDPGKSWTANDIYDIDAMALAVPYCDVVVADKACHSALSAAHLGERMRTALLRNLEELPDVLDCWKSKRSQRLPA